MVAASIRFPEFSIFEKPGQTRKGLVSTMHLDMLKVKRVASVKTSCFGDGS